MKNYTVTYLPGLGEYLDNNNIIYFNNGNNTITFACNDLFLLGVMYQQWRTKNNI